MNGENLLQQLDDAYIEIHQLRHALAEIAKVVGTPPVDRRSEASMRRIVDAVTMAQTVAEDSTQQSQQLRRMLGLLGLAQKLYLQLRLIEQEPVTPDGAEREADVRSRLEAALGIGEETGG